MRYKHFTIAFIVSSLLIFSSFLSGIKLNVYEDNALRVKEKIKSAGFWEITPFIIDEDGGGDYTWAEAALEPWCSGSGTWSEPYLIENVVINGSNSGHLNSIEILHSNKPFIIRNCTLVSGGSNIRGIHLSDSSNATITKSNCSNVQKMGISIYYCNGNINITKNIVNNNEAGISTLNTNNVIISNNTAKNNEGDGILVNGGTNIKVIGNLLIANGYAGNYNGISIYSISGCVISNNTCKKNVGMGIHAEAHNSAYINNTLNNNGMSGMWLLASDNIIENNTLYNNTQNGFHYAGSRNNVSGNIIKENKERGFYSTGGQYNLFYNNYFLDNQIENVYDNGGRYNDWNNSEVGNYWSDYPYDDADDNGIGDTPYQVRNKYGEWDYLPIWYDGPTITILEPKQNMAYGSDLIPPDFTLEITDPNHNSTWYTIDSYPTKYFINESGTIDSGIWSTLSEGYIEIHFFANDSFGNIDSNSVTVIKDKSYPNISILQPIANTFYGNIAPDFELSIQELTLNTTWYILDGGSTNFTFTGLTGIINQTEWDDQLEGPVIIRFYANDTFGRISFEEITIQKDITKPNISIIQPYNNSVYGNIAPDFEITIQESALNTTWYTIDGGSTNFTFTGLTGIINQTEWDDQLEGPVIIRFYANDSFGWTSFKEIIIQKDISNPLITILTPLANAYVNRTPPALSITIVESNLDVMWYSINGGANHTFSFNCIIDQSTWENIWDSLSHGASIVITVYVNDTLGHIGHAEVTVIKYNPPTEEPSIPGYHIIVLSSLLFIPLIIIRKKYAVKQN